MRNHVRRLLGPVCLALTLLVGASAFAADAPDAAPAAPSVAAAAAPQAIPWLSVVLMVLTVAFTVYQKALSPQVHAKLVAEAADSHASAFQQKAATFGNQLLTLVEAQAAHVFEAEQAGERSGQSPKEALTEATTDLLNGLGDAGKGLASQYMGVAGSALYDLVEGLIKSQLQTKRNEAAAAGAAAASAAVPAAVAAVAGPAAVAVINKPA